VILRVVGVVFASGAIAVLLIGGFATVCNSFEPGCSDQGYQGADTVVTFALLTAIGTLVLGAAASAAFRWARGPSLFAGAIVVGTLVLALALGMITLADRTPPPPVPPDSTPRLEAPSRTV